MGIKFLLTHDFSKAKTILESCGEKHLSGFIADFHTLEADLQSESRDEVVAFCKLANNYYLPTIAYFNPKDNSVENGLLLLEKNYNREATRLQTFPKKIDWRQSIL